MSPANHYQFSALLTSLLNVILLWIVVSKGTNKSLVRNFVFYCSSIIFWSFFVTLATTVKDPSLSLLFSQFCHAGANLIPLFYLHFVYTLLGLNKKSLLVRSFNLAAIFFVIIILAFPLTFFRGVSPKYGFPYFPDAGKLYLFWTIYFFVAVGVTHVQLFKASFKLQGIKRKNLMVFFIANLLGYAGGVGCFLPVYNIDYFPFPYGPYGVVLFSFVTAYSIFMYRFLDIDLILKKTIVFAGIVTAAVFLIAFPFTLIQIVIGKALGFPHPFVIMALAIMTSVLIYRPVESMLINLTDKYLFQKKIDSRNILKYASAGLSRVNSLRYQLQLITHFLTLRTRIRSAAIYIKENGMPNFVLKSSRCFEGSTSFQEQLPFDSQILMYLKKERSKPYLERYDVENQSRKYQKNSSMFRYDLLELKEEMQKLNAYLVIPSFYQDELQGVLVLGEKRSEEPYNEEDINLFQTIAQESAIAFENARKHDKLVEQHEEMKRINEELRRTQEEVIQAKEAAAVAAISAGISHEVNNAIVGLTGAIAEIKTVFNGVRKSMIEWFRSGEAVPERQKYDIFMNLKLATEHLTYAKNASHYIEDVVQTLSQIAKGKNAKMTRISPRIFLKNAVSASILRTYGDRVRSEALENPPELDMDKDIPAIKGHTALLDSVFVNLFKNAIYAMKGISPKKIKITAMADPDDKGMVRIEFSDNGCGIPPEVLPKIFDYGVTTKKEHGEGKGLYNVKMIIEEQHKGKIDVQSKVGKGTTFIIRLPVWQDEEEDEEE